MATSLMIEEEFGVVTRAPHPHNGYFAGDFSGVPFHELRLGQSATVAPAAPSYARPVR